jgi:hypothetical protein
MGFIGVRIQYERERETEGCGFRKGRLFDDGAQTLALGSRFPAMNRRVKPILLLAESPSESRWKFIKSTNAALRRCQKFHYGRSAWGGESLNSSVICDSSQPKFSFRNHSRKGDQDGESSLSAGVLVSRCGAVPSGLMM